MHWKRHILALLLYAAGCARTAEQGPTADRLELIGLMEETVVLEPEALAALPCV